MLPTDLTVGAVVFHDGRYLMVEEHATRRVVFSQPGGHIEAGETPEIALVREYLEETELVVGNLKKITTVKHSYTIYRVTLHCYFCSSLDGRFEPVLHGAQEYRWVKPGELSYYAFPAGHRKLIQYWQNEMKFLLGL